LPKEAPTPQPYALQLGLDWLAFHTPPYAGGLADQPMQLLRAIRSAVNTYHAINAYKDAHTVLSGESLSKWYAANRNIMKFMEYVWSLQNALDG